MDNVNTPGQSAEVTPQPVPTENTPQAAAPQTPVATPQEQQRQDVYNQYAALYQNQPEPQKPVTPAPAVSETPPVAEDKLDEFRQAIEELRAENARLQSQIKPPAPPVTEAPPQVHPMQQWVELMASNKLDEAEALFIEAFGPKIAAKMQPQMVQQSVEANRAEIEIERFVTQFESANQDLMPLKDYVVLGAERRLNIAQNEGRIKSPADFVNEYRKAVTEEANAIREKLQTARSAGKEEAMTVNRQVLSATTLPPSPINNGQTSNNQEPSTPTDYLAMRREMLATRMGLRST